MGCPTARACCSSYMTPSTTARVSQLQRHRRRQSVLPRALRQRHCQQPATIRFQLSRLDPTTKMLYDMTPLPSNTRILWLAAIFPLPTPPIFIVPTITFRVDHSFGQKDKAYIRYTSNNQTNVALRNYPNNSPATLAADGIPAGASGYKILLMRSLLPRSITRMSFRPPSIRQLPRPNSGSISMSAAVA